MKNTHEQNRFRIWRSMQSWSPGRFCEKNIIFFLSYYWRNFKVKISKNSSNKKVLLDWDNNFLFRWPYSKSPSLRRYPDPKLNFPYLITEERSIFPLQLWNNAQELELKTHLFTNGVENWKKLYNLSPVREMWHKCFWAPGLCVWRI